mmetsp:Transcript_111306/g.156250  ORF Transcript_111306/g.156250 Transcript_111306/m.156250 type:complete len:202 (+) Transcript_111306:85-690(+)
MIRPNTPESPTVTRTETKRRVQFAFDNGEADQEHSGETKEESPKEPLTLTDETCRQLWYQPDEIGYFKHDTRNLVLFGQSFGGDDDMSGLERYNMERSKHKRDVLHYILAIHRLGKDADFLGKASRTSTAWASDIASQQGFYDYCAVYDPLAVCLGDDDDFKEFLESGDKRKASEPLSDVFCGRRVRQRTVENSSQLLQTA